MSSEPISWLLLERYALGELSSEERADVERRLAQSREDRACLQAILDDPTVLPPLRKRRGTTPYYYAGALSLAAATALVMLRPLPSRRVVSDGVKGGEVALTLLSERTGSDPRVFRDGDRFKLLVTCPTWLSSRVSVLMFQGGKRYEPLAPVDAFACGNQVPWPGAFTLDGREDVEVCVAWDDELARFAESAGELDDAAVCVRLRHE